MPPADVHSSWMPSISPIPTEPSGCRPQCPAREMGTLANVQPARIARDREGLALSVEGEIIRQDRHEAALCRGSCQLVLRQRRGLPVDDSRCQLLNPRIDHPTDTQIHRMRYRFSRSVVHKRICANHHTSTKGAERCT